mgnify:CR=1 FL=1
MNAAEQQHALEYEDAERQQNEQHRQNAEQDRLVSCLREEHRKSQFHA